MGCLAGNIKYWNPSAGAFGGCNKARQLQSSVTSITFATPKFQGWAWTAPFSETPFPHGFLLLINLSFFNYCCSLPPPSPRAAAEDGTAPGREGAARPSCRSPAGTAPDPTCRRERGKKKKNNKGVKKGRGEKKKSAPPLPPFPPATPPRRAPAAGRQRCRRGRPSPCCSERAAEAAPRAKRHRG